MNAANATQNRLHPTRKKYLSKWKGSADVDLHCFFHPLDLEMFDTTKQAIEAISLNMRTDF